MQAHFHVHWPPLLLALALSLLAVWLNHATRRADRPQDASFALSPDHVVDRFDATVYGADGHPKHHLSANRLSHSQQSDETRLDAPLYRSADASVQVKAQRALLQGDANLMYFLGQVHASRRSQSSSDITMDTDYLVVHADQHLLRTNKPVTLRQGRLQISANGMVVDDANKQLSLTGGVQARYEPHP